MKFTMNESVQSMSSVNTITRAVLDDITAAHELYDGLTDDIKSMEQYSETVNRLCAIQEDLETCFYSQESYDVLNLAGHLYELVDCSAESITSQIAVEGIGDKIKEAMKKFWEMIKSVIQKVADFFKNIFSGVVTKAEALKASGGANIDFSYEANVLSKDQWSKLEPAALVLREYAEKNISKTPTTIEMSAGILQEVQELAKKFPDVLEYSGSQLSFKEEITKTEKKSLQSLGWGTSQAMQVAEFLIKNYDRTSKLGEIATRAANAYESAAASLMKKIGDGSVGSADANNQLKLAFQVLTKSYVLLARANKYGGQLIKAFTAASKPKKEEKK